MNIAYLGSSLDFRQAEYILQSNAFLDSSFGQIRNIHFFSIFCDSPPCHTNILLLEELHNSAVTVWGGLVLLFYQVLYKHFYAVYTGTFTTLPKRG